MGGGSDASDAFCMRGMAMDMSMSGFRTFWAYGSGDVGCIAFLVPSWVIASSGAFLAACVATFVLAVAAEGFVALRRAAASGLSECRCLPRGARGHLGVGTAGSQYLEGFFYLIQVALGYLLMLVAMTYQLEFFLCVVLGLAAGHMAFNPVKRRMTAREAILRDGAGSVLACCSMREDAEGIDEDGIGGGGGGGIGGGGAAGVRWQLNGNVGDSTTTEMLLRPSESETSLETPRLGANAA